MLWKLYNENNEALAAMEQSCAEATSSIDLEVFILSRALISGSFGKLLRDKARSGVRVRIILDMVGSIEILGTKEEWDLRDSGVQIAVFHPISIWRLHNFTSWYFRDHRKILIVDGKFAYTGGVNFKHSPHPRRDTQIFLDGPVVAHAKYAFDRMWANARAHKFNPFGRPVWEGEFAFPTHSPHRRERYLLRECIKAIIRARQSVSIITPYFVPSLRITTHLRAAAKRGVDVRILLPSLSDHTLADLAARSYLGTMLRSGIRIFIYKPPNLHAKVMTVDEDFSMVGSLNIDNLSFLYNYEAGVVSINKDLNRQLREQFVTDLDHSREVKLEEWRKRSLKDKILEILSWPIHFAV